MAYSHSISVKSVNQFVLSLLFFTGTISFSWNPVAILTPLFLFIIILNIFVLKYSHVYIIIFVLSYQIFVTRFSQIMYIEYVRNIIIALLIPFFYTSLNKFDTQLFLKLLKVVYYGSLFVVLYILFFEVPFNLELFFGERRGFYAREYLFFGRIFPFSLGVTHLNLYLNFILTYVYIKELMLKRKNMVLYITFFLLVIISRSRSPIVFLAVIHFIYSFYLLRKGVLSKRKYIKIFITFLCLMLAGIVLYNAFDLEFLSMSRLLDSSRLIFYAKGFSHMLTEPWGNSMLYLDPTMPLLNYHNTFLSLGNKIGIWFFLLLLMTYIVGIYKTARIKNLEIRFTLYILQYFTFHNFMIEDVVKFDYFVLLIHLMIMPLLLFNKKIYHSN